MSMLFRHGDPRYPFLWESNAQPPSRWHGPGEGPAQYFADTPDGAWAEFIRHEELTDPEDLETIQRAIWAVEVPDELFATPALSKATLFGDASSYSSCQAEARRLRGDGAERIHAFSAALLPGEARGQTVDGGLKPGARMDGRVVVLFGLRRDLMGWLVVESGRPANSILSKVRHF